jgi:hypothetical protein
MFPLILAGALVLFGARQATAQSVVYYSPAPAYYAPPVVSYYSPPVVYAPAVSYYAPAVSYYAPRYSYYAPPVSYYPSVSYYAPGAVTTTRYGLFGRPRYSTTYYGSYYYR